MFCDGLYVLLRFVTFPPTWVIGVPHSMSHVPYASGPDPRNPKDLEPVPDMVQQMRVVFQKKEFVNDWIKLADKYSPPLNLKT